MKRFESFLNTSMSQLNMNNFDVLKSFIGINNIFGNYCMICFSEKLAKPWQCFALLLFHPLAFHLGGRANIVALDVKLKCHACDFYDLDDECDHKSSFSVWVAKGEQGLNN
jgi:hypothetical protein